MELLETILNHTSVRHFEDKKLEQDLKDKLVKAAQSGSSSNFVQAYSIIEVSNPEILEAIQVLSNNSGSIVKSGVFYIFVADLNRNYQISKETNTDSTPFKSMDALLVSIVDATIAAQNMMLYAESINLGGCYIGGIRNDLFSIANLLKLPKYTLPIFGLTLGYPQDKNEVKPRLAQNDIVHLDHYELMDKSMELAESILANSSMSLSLIKKALDMGMDLNIDAALELETGLVIPIFGSKDQIEGISAFKEKRKPNFRK